jgi:hypothetical protein
MQRQTEGNVLRFVAVGTLVAAASLLGAPLNYRTLRMDL